MEGIIVVKAGDNNMIAIVKHYITDMTIMDSTIYISAKQKYVLGFANPMTALHVWNNNICVPKSSFIDNVKSYEVRDHSS